MNLGRQEHHSEILNTLASIMAEWEQPEYYAPDTFDIWHEVLLNNGYDYEQHSACAIRAGWGDLIAHVVPEGQGVVVHILIYRDGVVDLFSWFTGMYVSRELLRGELFESSLKQIGIIWQENTSSEAMAE